MLGALKFLPRDQVEQPGEEADARRGKKKRHLKGKESASRSRGKGKRAKLSDSEDSNDSADSSRDSDKESGDALLETREDVKTKRAEAGLGWMLQAPDRQPLARDLNQLIDQRNSPGSEERSRNEKSAPKARELTPYVNGGEDSPQNAKKDNVSVVGDGGASWRLKALKRAQEQAAREGRKLDEVVEERWGSLGAFTSSVAVQRSAHANAHLHAIRDRKSRNEDNSAGDKANDASFSQRTSHRVQDDREHSYSKEHGSRMRVPVITKNLSWKSRRKYENQPLRDADAAIVRSAASTFNKFSNDGSFLKSFKSESTSDPSEKKTGDDEGSPEALGGHDGDRSSMDMVREPGKVRPPTVEDHSPSNSIHAEKIFANSRQKLADDARFAGLSANQIAAKAMRLRLSGKAKEAEDLMRDYEVFSRESRPETGDIDTGPVKSEQSRQFSSHARSKASVKSVEDLRFRNKSYDAEMADSIARNKTYRGDETDEYDDYGGNKEMEQISRTKGKKKFDNRTRDSERDHTRPRLPTRAESCQFCFENAQRPKHLVIAIADSTYLMLPPTAPLVPFHCYIVPMQHDGATRNVDESVWQELRNFKKCLVRMFGDQGKEAIFLETAMKLSRQRRHCYIECIPVPSDVAQDAPLYFKKAIDEAEDEWSQHNAKKLIDTRQKGLRNSIPKNFPYFHVEFGMGGGYCHVIDDETSFKPQFGRDVIAGMLDLPEGHRRQGSVEQQTIRVKEFLKLWEPFDWTKMLDN